MISDLEIARLCSAIYTDTSVFDYIDDGSKTGIFFGIKKLPDNDVIILRGSVDKEDWLRDFEAVPVFEYGLGYVHEGFNLNLANAHQEINGLVRPHPIIGGHSLGAGRAALLAGRMAIYNNSPSHVVLLGCPRAGCQALITATQGVPINSYKNRLDPVTDVPPSLPTFPCVDIRDFIRVDGMVDYRLGFPWDDHHYDNYLAGMEKING